MHKMGSAYLICPGGMGASLGAARNGARVALVFTVYYQAEFKGEKTCLMGTLWRVRN